MLSRRPLWSTARKPSALPLPVLRRVSSGPPLINIQNGTFYRHYPTADDTPNGRNPPLFPDLSFALPGKAHEPQHWAVIGAAGRTTLLDIFRGQLICLPPTARSYPFLLVRKDRRPRSVDNAIQYIGFTGEGSGSIGGARGAYLSARYESYREETDWTVAQFLKGQTSLNPLEVEEHHDNLLSPIVSNLQLGELLDMPVANLSNGQGKRARIAKALLNEPELLLLDGPFMGVDPATARGLSSLLHWMAKRSAPRLLLGLRPQDHVPDWITHLIIVGNSNEILLQGAKDDVVRELSVSNGLEGERKTPFPTIEENTPEGASKGLKLDRELLLNLKILQPTSGHSVIASTPGGEPLIEMDGVCVQYGSKPVLGDWVQGIGEERLKGLYWTVRRGQRWAITGPNGSGKTTLLSLITSDHPQAYAQPMRLFGRTRLPEAGKPGLSLFDLQARMGQSSPEIHAFFPRQLSIRQAVESAFADTFLSKPRLDFERNQDINAALAYFRPELDPDAQNKLASFPRDTDGDAGYADSIRFANLTPAQQRLVLFLRAVIDKPDLVILDEPFSGMSPILRNKCIHFLEAGQLPRTHSITAERRVSGDLHTSSSHEPSTGIDSPAASRESSSIRHRGLSDDQALIVVGHVKEEIPDSVRNYIRLPGGSGAGDQVRDETLDFRIGALYPPNAISDDRVWEGLWAPASEFARYTRQPESTNPSVAVTRHPDDEKFRWDYL